MNKNWYIPRLLLSNIFSLHNKTDELAAVLQTNDIDVCCITESWLTAETPTEAIDIDGYICYRCDRSDGRQGGGVACYVRQNLPFSLVTPVDSVNVESVWLLYRQPRMPRSMSHLLIGTVYHPPNAISHITSTYIVDNIDAILRQHPSAGVLVVGDFNKMADKPLRDLRLVQIVKAPTRKTAILDKIYSNISERYQLPCILPNIGKSDHRTVLLLPIASGTHRPAGHRVMATVRSNDHNNKSQLARHLAEFDWSAISDMTSPESMTNYFYDVTTSMLNFYLPLRVVVRYSTDKPWITDEFRRLIRQRQYAYTTHNTVQYHRLRNLVNRMSRKLRKQHYERNIEGLRSCNSSNWWRQTKLLIGQTSKPDLVGLANQMTDGDMQKLAGCINESLINVSDNLTRLTTTDSIAQTALPSEWQYTVTPQIVFNMLERINIHKAPGPDNLPNWFLRDFAFALCDPLSVIFNSSIQTGTMPSIWKRANVIAVPKTKPPKSIQQDIRPISLTPTLSKILESIIGRWMIGKISSKFDPKQFGAIKGRSTSHALVDILHKWHRALDSRQAVRIVFVDYAKAFDHVDHPTVMKKLEAIGVPPVILRWLHSFLQDRQQRVKIGDVYSDWASPNGSMPQGTWLGPYVFLTLINDLASTVELHKFVDDCTLSEILSTFNQSSMQQQIDNVNDWSRLNLMNINTRKTKEMLLGAIRNNPPPILQLDGQSIERVNSYKLLGLHVTAQLKWNLHVTTICSKAAQRLHFLKQLKHAGMSTDDLMLYYKSVVRPVTEYACAVWHSSLTKGQTKQLESIQRRAMKIIFSNNIDDVSHALNTLPTLSEHRDQLTKQFFRNMLKPSNCLHNLIPDRRDDEQISKLRSAVQYPVPTVQTERFRKSTIVYALTNYQ